MVGQSSWGVLGRRCVQMLSVNLSVGVGGVVLLLCKNILCCWKNLKTSFPWGSPPAASPATQPTWPPLKAAALLPLPTSLLLSEKTDGTSSGLHHGNHGLLPELHGPSFLRRLIWRHELLQRGWGGSGRRPESLPGQPQLSWRLWWRCKDGRDCRLNQESNVWPGRRL